LATVSANMNHSAVFPEDLPRWFIKLFTRPGDVILDPFLGSGTTAVVAVSLDRNYVGIEKEIEYCDLAKGRISQQKRQKAVKK